MKWSRNLLATFFSWKGFWLASEASLVFGTCNLLYEMFDNQVEIIIKSGNSQLRRIIWFFRWCFWLQRHLTNYCKNLSNKSKDRDQHITLLSYWFAKSVAEHFWCNILCSQESRSMNHNSSWTNAQCDRLIYVVLSEIQEELIRIEVLLYSAFFSYSSFLFSCILCCISWEARLRRMRDEDVAGA